jgi:hypothetical protein
MVQNNQDKTDANLKEIRAGHGAYKYIEEMKAWRKETTACQEPTEAL